jgi:hypothetical protein
MSWFTRRVQRIATDTAERYLASPAFDEMLRGIVAERVFVHHAARYMQKRHRPALSDQQAIGMAEGALTQMLADMKAKFGHAGYSWDRSAAEEMAEEYQVRHWEAA